MILIIFFQKKKIHTPPIQGFSNTSNPPPPLPPQNFHMLAFRVVNIGSGHPIPKPGSHLKNTPWVTGLGKFKDSQSLLASKRLFTQQKKLGMDPAVKNKFGPDHFCRETVNFTMGQRHLWPRIKLTVFYKIGTCRVQTVFFFFHGSLSRNINSL